MVRMVNLSTVLHVFVFITWCSCGLSSQPADSSAAADGRVVSYHLVKRGHAAFYSHHGQRQLSNHITYTRCPPGFVFPEHPDDPDVEWINGTNCALGCKSPVIDAETWESADQLGNGVNFVSFVSIVLLFITFWLVPRGATSLVLISSTMSLIPTFVQFVQHRRTFTERFCRDNAIPISAADGLTGCNIESFTTIYCAMALALSWMIQMFHIFLVIVLKIKEKKLPYLYWAYFAVIFLPPAAVTAGVFVLQHEGYSRGYIGCFTTEDAGDADIWYLFFPMFVVGCIGMLLMMCVIYRAVQWMSVAHDRTVHDSQSNITSGAASLNASQSNSPRDEEKKHTIATGTSSTALVSTTSSGDGVLVARGADVGRGGDKGTAIDVENVPAIGHPRAVSGSMSPVPEEKKSPNPSDFSLGMLSPTTRKFFNDISSPFRFASNKVGISSGEEFTPPNARGNKRPRAFFSSPSGGSPVKKISRMLELDTSFLVKIKALQAPLWFVGVFMFCLCGLVVGRFEAWRTQDNRTESFDDWVACVFSNYDGTNDSSWISVCGKQAEYNVNFHIGAWFAFTVLGHSLFITLSYLRMGDLIAYFREVRKLSKEKAKKERLMKSRSSFSRKSFSQNQAGFGARQASELENSGESSGAKIVSAVRRTVVSFIRVGHSSEYDQDEAESFVEVIEERDRSEMLGGNSHNFMSEDNSRSGVVIFSENGNVASDLPSDGYCDSGSASVMGDDVEMLDVCKKQSSFSFGKTAGGKPSPVVSSENDKFSSPPTPNKVPAADASDRGGIAVSDCVEESMEHLDTGTYREVLMNSSGFINMNETTRKLIQDSLHEVSQNRRSSATDSVKSPVDPRVSHNAASVPPGSEVQLI